MTAPRIGFAGMTHLGINSLVATAERGFEMVGFDENVAVIEKLNRQELPVTEPDLPETLAKNLHRIQFSHDIKSLSICDVVYISTDVPTDDFGKSDLIEIEKLIHRVAKNLSSTAILVILCQVPPGFTRKLEAIVPFERLFYQVETLVFGQALNRALHPERFILGAHSPTKPLPKAFSTLLKAFNCPLLPMRYESAELAKIAINCCLVASVSVANTLGELCEHIGADWSEIAPALKLDKRIGAYSYLSPGLGIAGGNLERDLNTVMELSQQHGTDSRVVEAWVGNSRHRRDWVLRTLHEEIIRKNFNPCIAVLGLAYKENTHSTKNSPSLSLLKWLHDFVVRVFDPIVPAKVAPKAIGASTAIAAAEGADVLIVMTPWPEFRTLDLKLIAQKMRGKCLIDPFRVFDAQKAHELGFEYHTLGVNKG